jgi:hypothetical protein
LASDGSFFPGRSSPPANPRSEIGEVKLTDENRSPHYVGNVGPSPEYHDIAGPGSLGGWSATTGAQRGAISSASVEQNYGGMPLDLPGMVDMQSERLGSQIFRRGADVQKEGEIMVVNRSGLFQQQPKAQNLDGTRTFVKSVFPSSVMSADFSREFEARPRCYGDVAEGSRMSTATGYSLVNRDMKSMPGDRTLQGRQRQDSVSSAGSSDKSLRMRLFSK